MIKLDLGGEPLALTASRSVHLPAAIAEFNTIVGTDRESFTKLLDKGYQVARPDLYSRQYGKCAFCEKNLDQSHQPVEHFRPKKGAEDKVAGKWQMATTHYWWLAWTWTNLYFACNDCNGAGRKGNRFPIKNGYHRIPHLVAPVSNPINNSFYQVSNEERMLVDPRVDDPFDHLRWTPVDARLAKKDWNWTIEGRDERGDTTIEVLELPRRIDEVNRYLKGVKLLCLEILRHVAEGRLQYARDSWDAVVRDFIIDPTQPFRNAAWCALDSLCPVAYRNANGFAQLPVPAVTYP